MVFVSGHVNEVVTMAFASMADHMQRINAELLKKYQLTPDFGLFWNFCVNAPFTKAGIHEVLCKPHVDAMNGAVLLCAVLVYYIGARASLL